jgi:hypothetical protein
METITATPTAISPRLFMDLPQYKPTFKTYAAGTEGFGGLDLWEGRWDILGRILHPYAGIDFPAFFVSFWYESKPP